MKKSIMTLGLAALTFSCAEAQEKVKSLQELKELQLKVKSVAKKNMSVTISIRSNRGSSGSGVIVNKDGLILTAAHVISGSKTVDVVFPDGRSEKAKVLGANFTKDSAMCKLIKPGPWKFAAIAESSDLKVGQYLVAMGHAGGYDAVRTPPVRFGRLLSQNRRGFVTTDCTLIGGDSGGPLYNLKGEVVGIHSNIGNLWSANNHAGTSAIKQDWQRLLDGDQWGSLGRNPAVDPKSPVIGIQMAGSKDGGVLVGEALDGGPAATAGIKAGDIILKINETVTKDTRGLITQIMKNKAGDSVKIQLKRDGKLKELELVLGSRRQMLNKFKK